MLLLSLIQARRSAARLARSSAEQASRSALPHEPVEAVALAQLPWPRGLFVGAALLAIGLVTLALL
jgi:hypothetical protein